MENQSDRLGKGSGLPCAAAGFTDRNDFFEDRDVVLQLHSPLDLITVEVDGMADQFP